MWLCLPLLFIDVAQTNGQEPNRLGGNEAPAAVNDEADESAPNITYLNGTEVLDCPHFQYHGL
jgi:hypothetical protein